MSRILIIEDEKNLARFVELELKHEGFRPEAPDEKTRRVGQSAAAASLPELK